MADELSVRIQICWSRLISQLEITKELENGMSVEQRELQSQILRILQSKLEAATVVISKPEKRQRTKGLYFLSLRETLESTVSDLEAWQKRFEPSWFQILKTGPPSVDIVLRTATDRAIQGSAEPAREGLKFRNAFNNSESILTKRILERLEKRPIPYCRA